VVVAVALPLVVQVAVAVVQVVLEPVLVQVEEVLRLKHLYR